MKAITLWQPWASLLACGAKQYETRSWATSYRGPIAIHAAKRTYCLDDFDFGLVRGFAKAVEGVFGKIDSEDLPLGVVVATAELVNCYEIRDEGRGVFIYRNDAPLDAAHADVWVYPDQSEQLFGDWTPGRYAWEFQNMKMLDTPIPAKGRQGLWNWEAG